MLFQKVIEDILAAHEQLEQFKKGPDFYLKLANGPYEPLVIERHGDVMSDPRVTFEYPTWRPTSHTLSSMGIYQENPRIGSFLVMWGQNLIDQGWKNAKVIELENYVEGQL